MIIKAKTKKCKFQPENFQWINALHGIFMYSQNIYLIHCYKSAIFFRSCETADQPNKVTIDEDLHEASLSLIKWARTPQSTVSARRGSRSRRARRAPALTSLPSCRCSWSHHLRLLHRASPLSFSAADLSFGHHCLPGRGSWPSPSGPAPPRTAHRRSWTSNSSLQGAPNFYSL